MAGHGYYKKNVTKNKQPKPRFRTEREYDFLSNTRIVFKWATENHDLTRAKLELLLYLYSKALFNKKQLADFHKTIGIYQQKTLHEFLDKGFIMLWRVRSRQECALYALTEKGKRLCARMHLMCTGEEKIPLTKVTNRMLSKKDAPRIDGYWLDMMKRNNKEE